MSHQGGWKENENSLGLFLFFFPLLQEPQPEKPSASRFKNWGKPSKGKL